MKMPKKNLCNLDRAIRGVIAVVSIYFAMFSGDLIGDPIVLSILFIFGLANLASLLMGWCIVYQAVNLSSIRQ